MGGWGRPLAQPAAARCEQGGWARAGWAIGEAAGAACLGGSLAARMGSGAGAGAGAAASCSCSGGAEAGAAAGDGAGAEAATCWLIISAAAAAAAATAAAAAAAAALEADLGAGGEEPPPAFGLTAPSISTALLPWPPCGRGGGRQGAGEGALAAAPVAAPPGTRHQSKQASSMAQRSTRHRPRPPRAAHLPQRHHQPQLLVAAARLKRRQRHGVVHAPRLPAAARALHRHHHHLGVHSHRRALLHRGAPALALLAARLRKRLQHLTPARLVQLPARL